MKRFSCLLLLILLSIPVIAAAEAQKHYQGKKMFYNALSIVQNRYIRETSSWLLFTGTVDGIKELLGDEELVVTLQENEIRISTATGNFMVVSESEIMNNAYALTMRFSSLFDMIFQEQPDQRHTDIIYAAIRGMLASLDPYSYFIPPDDFSRLQEQHHGIYGGIGLEITMEHDQFVVVTPYQGSPAFLAGIRPGDQIAAIDGIPTAGLSFLAAAEKIRGPQGSGVTLTIKRPGQSDSFDIPLTRQLIPHHSVTARLIEPGIAYLWIHNFLSNTLADSQKALLPLLKQGDVKGLILDLRYNPGGLLDQALGIADFFLPEGAIASTVSRIRDENHTYRARPEDDLYNGPIVILVNKGSASVAEIMATTLRANMTGIIIGSETFGKGSVQTVFPLRSGGAVRFTTSELISAEDIVITIKGIEPDIQVEDAGMIPSQAGVSIREPQPGEPDSEIPVPLFREYTDDPLILLGRDTLLLYQQYRQESDLAAFLGVDYGAESATEMPGDNTPAMDTENPLTERKTRLFRLLRQAAGDAARRRNITVPRDFAP